MQATQTLTWNFCVCFMVCLCKRKYVRLYDPLQKPQSELKNECVYRELMVGIFRLIFQKKKLHTPFPRLVDGSQNSGVKTLLSFF